MPKPIATDNEYEAAIALASDLNHRSTPTTQKVQTGVASGVAF
jgi:hypothetical protein